MKTVLREIEPGHGFRGEVDLNSPVLRYPDNPILTVHHINEVWLDPGIQVVTAHNAGVAVTNGTTVMLFRSHLRCGKSVIGVARSHNGIDGWHVTEHPVIIPATMRDNFAPDVNPQELVEIESGGVEDPRMTFIDGTCAVTYSAYHGKIKNRVRVSLATTDDFLTFRRWGPMLRDVDMRNVVLFPERINGRFAALFRPNDDIPGDTGGAFTQIRIGYSDDWMRGPWSIEAQPIMQTGSGPGAFADKIGPGAPPIKTAHGWISIFHGVRTTMAGNPYVLGVALHDLSDPSHVQVSAIPILFPSPADCRVRETDYVHVPNVVFTCGAVRRDDGTIVIYYGGNDTVMNVAATHEDVLIALCKAYGQNALTGEILYPLAGR